MLYVCPEQQRPSSGILRKMELMLQKKMQSTVQTLSSEATLSKSARPTLFALKLICRQGQELPAQQPTSFLKNCDPSPLEIFGMLGRVDWNLGVWGIWLDFNVALFHCEVCLMNICIQYTVGGQFETYDVISYDYIYMCVIVVMCGFTTFCSLMDIICGQATGWSNFYELTENVRQLSIGSRCPISQTARPDLTCEGFSHAWRSIWRSRPGIAKAF